MRKLVLLLSVIVLVNYVYAQYDDDLESMDDVNRRINNYLENAHRDLNEQYRSIHEWAANFRLNRQTQNGTSSGIRFDYESSSRTSYSSQQRANKVIDNAQHQEWINKQYEKRRIAAEQERIRKERERKEKYDKAYIDYMEATAVQDAYLHAKLENRATIYKDFMYNYQTPDIENLIDRLTERYIPSNSKSNLSAADIVDEQRKSYNNQNIIKPFEEKYYAGGTSNWDKALYAELIKNKIDNLPNTKQLAEEIAMNDYGESEIIDYKIELIANGCGTGNPNDINISRIAAYNASKIDIRIYMLFNKPMPKKDAMQIQTEACNQHDLDYFYGVNKKDADLKLAQTGPIKGFSLSENILYIPQNAYDEAQKERAMSEYIERKFNYTPDYYHKLVPIRKSDKMSGIHNK